ncbi:MAG: signal peptide peptidase SppA [Planctomycetota bacterium]|nr:signal peptide peptidase SppA [Planctomycetota bacterium]
MCFLMFFGILLSTLLGGVQSGNWQVQAPEEYVEGQGPDKIVLIEARGAIFDEPPGLFGGSVRESFAERLVRQLRQAARDESVRAVVLRVDSPGGGVTASDQIWREIRKLKDARGGVRVVVHMGDLCASGGYYISAPADAIIASPTTTTGSIGVIATHLDLSELLERKLGIREQTIKSGRLKDMFSVSRPMTEEERRIVQELIDSMYERFVRIVAEGRKGRKGIPEDMDGAIAAIRKIADGRVYTAEQAEKLGLVDGIGYLDDAIAEARKLAGLEEATVVRYGERKGLLAILTGEAELRMGTGPIINLNADALARRMAPRLEYRWAPIPLGGE